MSELRWMKMWWGDFFTDPAVVEMPGEVQGVYLVLLGRMWQRGGWLPAEDAVLARLLGIHVNAWRARFKPLIVPLLTHDRGGVSGGVTPLVRGGIFTQKRLSSELGNATAFVEKRKAILAKARAQKAKKSTPRASMTERQSGPTTEPINRSMHSSINSSVDRPIDRAIAKAREEEIEGSANHRAESPLSADPSELGALPPRAGDASIAVEGHATPPAHEGGAGAKPLPPKLEAALARAQPPDGSGPTSALLSSRLVQRGALDAHDVVPNRMNGAEPQEEPPASQPIADDEPAAPKPVGSVGPNILGKLRAQRGDHGKP